MTVSATKITFENFFIHSTNSVSPDIMFTASTSFPWTFIFSEFTTMPVMFLASSEMGIIGLIYVLKRDPVSVSTAASCVIFCICLLRTELNKSIIINFTHFNLYFYLISIIVIYKIENLMFSSFFYKLTQISGL